MRIFKIEIDANNVQVLSPVDKVRNSLDFLRFDCEPKSTSWKTMQVWIYNPRIRAKNFYLLASGILAFDEKALNVCRTIFEMAGEILELEVERGPKLYLLNPLECINGLNYKTTLWDYYKDGTKGRILKYGFHPERVLNESSIFKIPETSKTDIFCWADIKNSGDEFYHLYHMHNLTGLVFEELYNSNNEDADSVNW